MQRNYKEILQAISFHKDFGKRNPIDIGIELGYSQQEVEEMIQIISEEIHKEEIFILKNDPEKNTNSQSDEDSSTYHFSYRDININSKEVRLYYDGKDINKRSADIIGLNENNVLFAELDDYLIYLDEEDCSNKKLIRISKKTGEKKVLDFNYSGSTTENQNSLFCIPAVRVRDELEPFFGRSDLDFSATTSIIRYNVETGAKEYLELKGTYKYGLQASTKYLIYVSIYEEVDTLFCYDLEKRKTEKIEIQQMLFAKQKYRQSEKEKTAHFFLLENNLYYMGPGGLSLYNIDNKQNNCLLKRNDMNEITFNNFLGRTSGFYSGYLYTILENEEDDKSSLLVMSLDVTKPAMMRQMQFPIYGRYNCRLGYGAIYYVSEDYDAILYAYDIVSQTCRKITEFFPVVSSYKSGGIFNKETKYHIDGDFEIIGEWIYYDNVDEDYVKESLYIGE